MRRIGAAATAAFILLIANAARGDERDDRISDLERVVRELREEVTELKADRSGPVVGEPSEGSELAERLAILEAAGEDSPRPWTRRFTIGGYGEVHLNFGEGSAADRIDYHRFVLFVGHEFADWLSLAAELEIEHAAVGGDFDGELVFEQLAVDALLSAAVNVRFGRVLTPVGLVNRKHEPPSFNGVERPTFSRVVVPTTWSSDGLGIFGTATPLVSYQAYVVAGLDGTGFSATSGIRGGRVKDRPSISDPALTGRLDLFPLAEGRVEHGQHLRFGLSAWVGGGDSGVRLVSADFEYTISDFDFRGAIAYGGIDTAREIGGGVASAIFGWFAEAAFHVFPDAWREGRLAGADLVLFLRYDSVDTQFRMPAGVAADPRGDRREITVGATFFLRPNVVLKIDWQTREDGTGADLPDLLNLGIGWQF